MIELNRVYNEDCIEGIRRIADESIDCVLTDPPYLYLKKQRLERPFDEQFLFSEFKRILKPTGFVVLFGRGTSFYRWNTILAELGFTFKEEIVWDKLQSTSPVMRMSRIHETISLHGMPKANINKCKVPYVEMKRYDIQGIFADIKRLNAALHSPESLKSIQTFLENDCYDAPDLKKSNNLSISTDIVSPKRCIRAMQSIKRGMNEKTIIKEVGNRRKTIHPTQKPVRLLERLLALTTKPDSIVLDPFSGSCSTEIACINTGRRYIGFEIDKEYYEAGVKRINEHQPQLAI